MVMIEVMAEFGRSGSGKGFLLGLLGLIFSVAGSLPAAAQTSELQPLLDRLQRLERDIRTLNVRISKPGQTVGTQQPALVSGAPDTTTLEPAGIARIDARLAELEQDLRVGTGRIEEMTFQLQQIGQRLEKLIADVDYRLSALEGMPGRQLSSTQPSPPNAATVPTAVQKAVPAAPSSGVLGTLTGEDMKALPSTPAGSAAEAVSSPPPVQEEARKPESILPQGGAKERYSYAFSLLRKAEYEKAEAAFAEFVKLYPDDPLSRNARYWIGETHYVRAQYVKAAEVFLAAYQADPKGVKAPDTLLKLGMSLGNLEKKAQACASFDKLLTDFPKASSIILNKVKTERQRYGCK